MSTMNDLLQRATELVVSINELLATDTARALPEVAEELGATEILNAGVEALVQALSSLHHGLDELGQTAIVELNAIRGLMGMLEPLVGALGDVVGAAGDELAGYGLDGVVEVTERISQGFAYAEAVLSAGSSLDVDEERFEGLVTAFAELRDTVDRDLRVEPDEPQGLTSWQPGGVA